MNEIIVNQSTYASLKHFCIFIGYPYSGHSLVGSILDAHPNAVISHELHIGRYLKKGVPKEKIFAMILLNSMKFAQDDRTWNNYSYAIPGEWNGQFKSLQVIGDKKGGSSSMFFSKKTEVFEALDSSLGLPLKYIHVVRNPFDMISTMYKKMQNPTTDPIEKTIDELIRRVQRTIDIRKSIPKENLHDMQHEQLLSSPDESISSLFRFLQLEVPEKFIDNCKKIMYKNPHKSRFDISWSNKNIEYVLKEMSAYELFSNYTFNS